MDESCDVLVIGGGPAGSTAATLLARRGLDVLLLEKDSHPRFHIGESLLPHNLRIFERLGVAGHVAAMGVYKPGAEFISDEDGRTAAFSFAGSPYAGAEHAYHVRRSQFDSMLFEAARASGVRVRQQIRVTAVEPPDHGRLRVTAATTDREQPTVSARFVLDASGRDALLASRNGLLEKSKLNNTAAVFAHFRNVAPRVGEIAGAIAIHLVRDGWFWMIPLPDGVTSIGFVGSPCAFRDRREPLPDFFTRRIEESASVRDRMAAAERLTGVMGAANYSYRATRSWGDGWLMIGDAFGFIDPVFSSGVMLAMSAGEHGADIATAWLAAPGKGAALAARGERHMRAAMNRIGWLIHRINTPALRQMFLSPCNYFGMRDGVIGLLAGHWDADPRMLLPILAFRSAYHLLSRFEEMRPLRAPS